MPGGRAPAAAGGAGTGLRLRRYERLKAARDRQATGRKRERRAPAPALVAEDRAGLLPQALLLGQSEEAERGESPQPSRGKEGALVRVPERPLGGDAGRRARERVVPAASAEATEWGFRLRRRAKRADSQDAVGPSGVSGQDDLVRMLVAEARGETVADPSRARAACKPRAANMPSAALALVPVPQAVVADPAGQEHEASKAHARTRRVGGRGTISFNGSCYAKDLDMAALQAAIAEGAKAVEEAANRARVQAEAQRQADDLDGTYGDDEAMSSLGDSTGTGQAVTSDLVNTCFAVLENLADHVEPSSRNIILEVCRATRTQIVAADGTLHAERAAQLKREQRACMAERNLWRERQEEVGRKLNDLVAVFENASREDRQWKNNLAIVKSNMADLLDQSHSLESQLERDKERTAGVMKEIDQMDEKVALLDSELEAELSAISQLRKELEDTGARMSRLHQQEREQRRTELFLLQEHIPAFKLEAAQKELSRQEARVSKFKELEASFTNGIMLKRLRLEQLQDALAEAIAQEELLKRKPPVRERPEYRAMTPRPEWREILHEHIPCLEKKVAQHWGYQASLNDSQAAVSTCANADKEREARDKHEGMSHRGSQKRATLRRMNSILAQPFTTAVVRKMIELVSTHVTREKTERAVARPQHEIVREQVLDIQSMLQETRETLKGLEELIPPDSPYYHDQEARREERERLRNGDKQGQAEEGGRAPAQQDRVANALRRATKRLRKASVGLGMLHIANEEVNGDDGGDGDGDEDDILDEEKAYSIFAAKARKVVQARKKASGANTDPLTSMIKLYKETQKKRAAESGDAKGASRTSVVAANPQGAARGQASVKVSIRSAGKAAKVLVCMGTDPRVPKFLRHNGKVRERELSEEDITSIIEGLLLERAQERENGCTSTFNDFVYDFLKSRFGIQALVAEWGYNIMNEFQKRSDSMIVAKVFLMVVSGELHEDVFGLFGDILEALGSFLCRMDVEQQKLAVSDSISTSKSMRGIQPMGKVSIVDVEASLPGFFPTANATDKLDELLAALQEDAKGKPTVRYNKLLQAPQHSQFIQTLLTQVLAVVTGFANKYVECIAKLTTANKVLGALGKGKGMFSGRPQVATSTVPLIAIKGAILDADRLLSRQTLARAIAKAHGVSEPKDMDWDYPVDAMAFARQLRSSYLLLPTVPLYNPDATIEVTPMTSRLSMSALVNVKRKTRVKLGGNFGKSFKLKSGVGKALESSGAFKLKRMPTSNKLKPTGGSRNSVLGPAVPFKRRESTRFTPKGSDSNKKLSFKRRATGSSRSMAKGAAASDGKGRSTRSLLSVSEGLDAGVRDDGMLSHADLIYSSDHLLEEDSDHSHAALAKRESSRSLVPIAQGTFRRNASKNLLAGDTDGDTDASGKVAKRKSSRSLVAMAQGSFRRNASKNLLAGDTDGDTDASSKVAKGKSSRDLVGLARGSFRRNASKNLLASTVASGKVAKRKSSRNLVGLAQGSFRRNASKNLLAGAGSGNGLGKGAKVAARKSSRNLLAAQDAAQPAFRRDSIAHEAIMEDEP